METKFTDKHQEYLANPQFNEMYTELLISRLTHSNMSLEKDLGNVDDSINAIRVIDNFKAFKILLDNFYNPLNEELITHVANIINRSSKYISENYRKYGDKIAGTNEPISKAHEIKPDMEKLLYDYYNTWKNDEIFEREAKFHIEFLRIHPFEDGNGRTSRLLLNFNVMNQGHAPIIITDDFIQEYYDARNRFDVKWMRDMFERQSAKELLIFDELIERYDMEHNKKHV